MPEPPPVNDDDLILESHRGIMYYIAIDAVALPGVVRFAGLGPQCRVPGPTSSLVVLVLKAVLICL